MNINRHIILKLETINIIDNYNYSKKINICKISKELLIEVDEYAIKRTELKFEIDKYKTSKEVIDSII